MSALGSVTKSVQEAYRLHVDYMSLIAFETSGVTDGTQELVHRALTRRVLLAEVA